MERALHKLDLVGEFRDHRAYADRVWSRDWVLVVRESVEWAPESALDTFTARVQYLSEHPEHQKDVLAICALTPWDIACPAIEALFASWGAP